MSIKTPKQYYIENFLNKTAEQQKAEIKKLEEQIDELTQKCQLPIKPKPVTSLKLYQTYLAFAKDVLENKIVIESTPEPTLEQVFDIQNKFDVFWEKSAQDIVSQLERRIVIKSNYSGTPFFFSDLIALLKGKSLAELEELLVANKITLPTATNVKNDILKTILQKANKF